MTSGGCACMIHLSTFYIINTAGPVTSTVVAQIKTCLIVSLGWVMNPGDLGRHSLPGIILALSGIMLYSLVMYRDRTRWFFGVSLTDWMGNKQITKAGPGPVACRTFQRQYWLGVNNLQLKNSTERWWVLQEFQSELSLVLLRDGLVLPCLWFLHMAVSNRIFLIQWLSGIPL